jgi:NAD(P)-dependent dehydrogenase (short-subunit alcohol dehydrogenase family)
MSTNQSLNLTSHSGPYDAIDTKSALKNSATDKVVFITGASKGIGRSTAVAFAQAGAKAVYITARSEGGLKQTQELITQANPQTQCAYCVCDVTDAAAVKAAVEDCVKQFDGIDIADANAGYLGPWVKIAESDPDDWWRNWEVNLRGAYHVIRYTLPFLISSAQQRNGGHLILVSSVGAQLLMPGASDYQTSKHAINRLCEFVQTDHGDDGIKCFAIHPGGVATDIGKQMPEALQEYLTEKPELAANFAVWLCSGKADWAKGRYLSATWDVDELSALKDEIVRDDLLVNRLRGRD